MLGVFYTNTTHALRFQHSHGTFAQAAGCNNLRCSEPIMKGKPTVTNTMNSYSFFFLKKTNYKCCLHSHRVKGHVRWCSLTVMPAANLCTSSQMTFSWLSSARLGFHSSTQSGWIWAKNVSFWSFYALCNDPFVKVCACLLSILLYQTHIICIISRINTAGLHHFDDKKKKYCGRNYIAFCI